LYGGSIPSEASKFFDRNMLDMADFAKARRLMLDCQLRTFDVFDLAVLEVFDRVPREMFVREEHIPLAYSDRALDIATLASGETRVLPAPMVTARLVQALSLNAREHVLDVACGFGYSSAVLASLGAEVTGLDNDHILIAEAQSRLAKIGFQVGFQADSNEDLSVLLRQGNLAAGASDLAPFDAILVNGSVSVRPNALLRQLRPGGRLACVQDGQVRLYTAGEKASASRLICNCSAPLLVDFTPDPAFVF
jgi:protein-L-isoaspartate(D-aspartate) O-methyltransferase